jgi:lipoate-protein ligase A
MRYIELDSVDPAINLATEQFIFDGLGRQSDCFIIWQNDNAVIIGKNQNAHAEINATYVADHGIKVVRRLSGGGAVYHDLGNLNFTFITANNPANQLDMQLFCVPVAETLAKLGIDATIEGRNDITIDGRKFSGNAQYIKNGRVMHHGTIMFSSDLETVGQALNVSADKLTTRGIRSVKSRVTNVSDHLAAPLTIMEFKELLVNHVLDDASRQQYRLTAVDYAQIKEIADARYDTWAWNYGEAPDLELSKRKRIEGCGTLELLMDTSGGIISGLRIFGDFFGSGDIEEIEQLLQGCRLEADALRNALYGIDFGHYVNNLTKEQFLAIILD